jgi:hypothetical protein
MATLAEIEIYLDIELGEKILCNGKKKPDKNKYYYYRDQYYIIKLTHNMWMIASDSAKTRQIMRNHIFYCDGSNYARTRIGDSLVGWHRLAIDCNDDMVPDHVNRKTFDNRVDNLREVTHEINNRNRSIRSDNTSGKQGIDKCDINGYEYWRVFIRDNNKKPVQKLFSIDKLDVDEAKRQAIRHRRYLERLYGYKGE